MKNKIFALMFLSVFAVAALAGFASATTIFSENFDSGNLNSWSATGWTNNGSFAESAQEAGAVLSRTISTSGYSSISVGYDRKLGSDWESTDNFKVSWSTNGVDFNTLEEVTGNSNDALPDDSDFVSKSFNLPSSASDNSNFMLKIECTTNAADESCGLDNVAVSGTSSSTPISFCKDGSVNTGDLELKVDINNKGEGDDEEWLPLDTIEVEVELENNKDLDGNGDLDDVILELGLFKKGSSKNVARDMMWISNDDEKVKVGNIHEDDSDSHVFEFRVDPHEVDDASYELQVKAYPKGDEDKTCIDFSDDLTDFGSSDAYASIDIKKEDDRSKMVVVDENSYPALLNASCGQQVSLPVDVYNIGDRDFNDQIKVTLTNKELGIDESDIIDGDFNEGDMGTAQFIFNVPSNAQEGTYNLLMETYYDYDKTDDVYDEVSDETFRATLKVQGNCGASSSGKTSVSASLQSGGKAGQDLVIRSTITNSDSSAHTYTVNAAGYSTWATSANINPISLTLAAGESRDVIMTLNTRDDVSGEQTFSIEVLSEGQLAAVQPVSVNLQASGFNLSDSLGANWYLWLFGILNVILVVVIIIVAIRVMRK